MQMPALLPVPRSCEMSDGSHELAEAKLILIDPACASSLFFSAQQLKRVLAESASRSWEIATAASIPFETVGCRIVVSPTAGQNEQGYELLISASEILLRGNSAAGVFYGVQTLCQLIAQYGAELPCLCIKDWPDFPNRGVMLDVSRDKVPTMETLYALVDALASMKINQFQLYTEHTFAYRRHPDVWAAASPLTSEEILALDRYCRERFVELVPNQNSFGHMRRWLVLDTYRPLSEAPNGCDTPWGHFAEPFSLCPGDPGSMALLRDLYDELLPNFTSRVFNVGCDETVDLGGGRSKDAVEERGKGRVYLDFLLEIHRELAGRGRTMQFWADIILKHPELVPELPKNLIALVWGYEAAHPYADQCARMAKAGVEFYVCPGTSTWCSICGRTDNALANLRSAAEQGLAHGATGFLNTDWGDNGHWQPLSASYVPYAYGAAVSWCCGSNAEADVPALASRFLFGDVSGRAGVLFRDLGNLYRKVGVELSNNSALFRMLTWTQEEIRKRETITVDTLNAVESELDRCLAAVAGVEMAVADGEIIAQEIGWIESLVRAACARGRAAVANQVSEDDSAALEALLGALTDAHQAVWLARNRRGGLSDSQNKLPKGLA